EPPPPRGTPTSPPAILTAPATKPKHKPVVKPKVRCLPPILSLDLVGPRRLVAGQLVSFTSLVRNTGSHTARNLVLHMPIPPGFSLVSSKVAGARRSGLATTGGAVHLELGTLPGHSSRNATVTLRVNATASGIRVTRARVGGVCGATGSAVVPIRVTG